MSAGASRSLRAGPSAASRARRRRRRRCSGCAAPSSSVADLRGRAPNTGGGRHRHAGIDQHGRQRRQPERRADPLADAAHHPGARIEADRHVGARRPRGRDHAGIVERRARSARASSRSAAAASDEPPPMPAAAGRRLTRSERAELQDRHAVRRGAGPPRITRLSPGRPGRPGRRAAHRERRARARDRASSGRRRRRRPRGFPARDSRRRRDARARAGQVDLRGRAGGETAIAHSGPMWTTPPARKRRKKCRLPWMAAGMNDGPDRRKAVQPPLFLSAAPGASWGCGAPFGSSGFSALCGAATGAGTVSAVAVGFSMSGRPFFSFVVDLREVVRLGVRGPWRAATGTCPPAAGPRASRRRPGGR